MRKNKPLETVDEKQGNKPEQQKIKLIDKERAFDNWVEFANIILAKLQDIKGKIHLNIEQLKQKIQFRPMTSQSDANVVHHYSFNETMN